MLVITKRGFIWKPYREKYLKISFEDFVECFDTADDDRIWWSILSSSLTNGSGLEIDNKDAYNIMISKVRVQRVPYQVYLILLQSSILSKPFQVPVYNKLVT